jgi:hypothetical protein
MQLGDPDGAKTFATTDAHTDGFETYSGVFNEQEKYRNT